MKKLVVLLPVALAFAGCFNAERNCADFKTGKFRSEIIIDGQTKVTEFTRDDKYEIETYEGKTDTTAVRWINDCEFILEKENPKNAAERKGIHMKILTTKGNTYTFEFSLVGDTQKQKGTVTKLN
jgi:hypothetical protein